MSIFDTIYKYNLWGNGSGTGSLPWNNRIYTSYLQKILDSKRITNVLEIGCGDYRLWQNINYNGKYTGLDIVKSIINDNNIKYGNDNIVFINWDISKEKINIQNVDLIIIKDILMHLPNNIIRQLLSNIQDINPKYILITEDTHYMNLNYDIMHGMYRPLYIDKYIHKNYMLQDELYYYELTYIIYIILISILVLFNKLFLLLLFIWIPKKRISLFKQLSI
jgi:hypothetical protein